MTPEEIKQQITKLRREMHDNARAIAELQMLCTHPEPIDHGTYLICPHCGTEFFISPYKA